MAVNKLMTPRPAITFPMMAIMMNAETFPTTTTRTDRTSPEMIGREGRRVQISARSRYRARGMTFACEQCGASVELSGVSSARCPYCASPSVVERAPPGRPRPAYMVAFGNDEQHARAILARWLGRKPWFADGSIARAQVDALRGVYVPAYLYSAVAHTTYSVSIGEHYEDTEEVEETDAEGKKTKRTRTITRTEHRPLAGLHVGYITDVVVSGSAGLANRELEAVEPFDLRQLRRHAPELVSGWIAEDFARDHAECIASSRTEALDDIGARLRRFMPGDSYSDLTWSTKLSWEAMEPILVPVWIAAARYRDDRPPLRIVINGQTGAVHGDVPIVWWRVMIAVLVLAAVGAAIYLLWRQPS